VILFYEAAFLLNGCDLEPVSFWYGVKLSIMSISTKMNLLRVCPAPHPKRNGRAFILGVCMESELSKGLKKKTKRKQMK
jgi:hypothetical protein